MISSMMIFQAVISILLILMVLLQFGKGAEAGLISGGASDSVFTSSQQGNILSKITTVLFVIFLVNSVALAKMQSSNNNKSILDSETPITRPLSDAAKKDSVKPTNTATKEVKDAPKDAKKASKK